uniref:Vacuolar protein sorting-associated protein 72 homolog n=1 Tax=Crassostrea virginica TaxID=6565 RepID=A0A8B8CNX6_CRAVI|nr:vacuolar protein sorting-associated protein 72 homolog [Crassostrea virginica]
MAATREKRNNAGSKMARLLEAEDEDEFYKTTYGGFDEEEGDGVYESEESDDDETDSDISIDENDEPKSDNEDEGPKKKRRVVTKAYKEPPAKKKTDEKKPKPKKDKVSKVQIYHTPEKKKLRNTTSEKSKLREERDKEREARAQMLKDMAAQKRVSEVRRLTQEELLEEAKITEEENVKSLENYQRMELEKKKNRIQKQMHKGPIIRYHSLTMPLIEELPPEPEISVDEDSAEPQRRLPVDENEKCSRTFITFTDERNFRDYFSQKRIKVPHKQFCPVTKLPAKYYDPVTQTPFANLQAFKCIREAYAQQLAEESSQRKK